jgi:1,4-alpha-glucan branching enzyme
MKSPITESKRKKRTSPAATAAPADIHQKTNEDAREALASGTTETAGMSARPGVAVVFQCVFPGAGQVSVAGSFNDWQPSAAPLKNLGDGHWRLDLTLHPGRYEYRFIVDGNWADDPLGRAFVENPFGTRNCVLLVDAPPVG